MISSILVVARDGRPRLERRSREARSAKPSADCARPAVIAAWHQNTNGENRSADSGLSHAANFMWQRTGKKPDREDAKDFYVCWSCSRPYVQRLAFAAARWFDEGAHMYAGVARSSALSGTLHGGANARFMVAAPGRSRGEG